MIYAPPDTLVKEDMRPLQLGGLKFDVPYFLAPLSGYSDRAMRQLCRRFGSPFGMPGVMLDTTTVNPTVIRKGMNAIVDDEHPIGGQIMGTDPAVMAQAAAILEQTGYDLIDLNFACPVPKVLRRGRGGCLLGRPEDLMAIYRAVREAVQCPITMKLRVGFDSDSQSKEHFWEICESAFSEGVDAIMVHGRTVVQRYKSFPDWDVLAQLKVRFPHQTIIGSGNLFSAKAVVQKLQQTGVDGALIARGAIGNPWIFEEIRALLAGSPLPPAPTVDEQGEVILQHFDEMLKDYPEGKAIGLFRKFTVRYARRHPEKNKVQMDLMAAESDAQLRGAMKKWYHIS
jgi:nifR3 family TIM-barrel protein